MISIILSTHNGADRLPVLLESFCNQEGLSSVEFEFIAVDNASNDETCTIVEKYQNDYPWLRYVKEEKLGINFARNRGIFEAKGEVLIFIDDDITLSRTWLVSYRDLFDANSDAWLAGGRVTCVLPERIDLPAWLAVEGEFSFPYITFSVELGNAVRLIALDGGAMPVGPNMAFRRKIFEDYGLFRTDLGLKGKSLMPGAEYEYFSRLRHSNHVWYYVPTAHAFHPIKASQLNQSYFLKRTYGVGRVAAKTMSLPANTRKLGPVPIFCFRLLLESTSRYLLSLPSGDQQKIFFLKAQVYKIVGLIYEWVSPRID